MPATVSQRARLLKIYRLLQPSGIFRNPSKFYLAGELRARIARAGFRLKREASLLTSESIPALLRCYPNLPAAEKKEILRAYLEAPASFRKACRVSGRQGGLRAAWNWAVFAALKP